MPNEIEFFTTDMPTTRPADYYLGCCDGSVYMDFVNCGQEQIRLKRISFDGYGCCDLNDEAIPLSQHDSQNFKEIIAANLSDQTRLASIVRKTILENRKLIWKDALLEYTLV